MSYIIPRSRAYDVTDDRSTYILTVGSNIRLDKFTPSYLDFLFLIYTAEPQTVILLRHIMDIFIGY